MNPARQHLSPPDPERDRRVAALISLAEHVAADGPSAAMLQAARRRAWFTALAALVLFLGGLLAVLFSRDRDPDDAPEPTPPATTVPDATAVVTTLDVPVGTSPSTVAPTDA